MLLIIALFGVILGLLYYAAQNRLNYWDRRGIPNEKPVFPKGNAVDWPGKKQLSVVFRDYYLKFKKCGNPFAGFLFFFNKTILVTDIEMAKKILIKDFNNFENRGIFFNEIDDPLSATLITIEGQKWRNLRHKLSPTFTSGKMKHMQPLVVKVAEEMVKVFNEKVTNPEELQITDLMGRYTADVIGSCAFGLNCNSLRDPNAEFVEMGTKAITKRRYYGMLDFLIFGFPKFSRKIHLKLTLQEVEDFYFRIIRDTVTYRLKSKEKRNDFMDMLIEMYQKQQEGNTAEGLTFEELAAQAFIFFVAGFETSSTTMGFALYELAMNQEIQDKLRIEIKSVLSNNNNEFSYDNIKGMAYLEKVVMETLRKYPVLGHLTRQANSDYSNPEDSKYFIDKESMIIIPVLGIHYDPEIYPDPELFNPERFNEDEIAARPACSWLPFGDGPRNCIGSRFGLMQACVGLAHLISNYKFSISPRTQIPLEFEPKNLLISSKNGIHLKVEKI